VRKVNHFFRYIREKILKSRQSQKIRLRHILLKSVRTRDGVDTVAVYPITVLFIYLTVGLVMGLLLGFAPDQRHRCPLKHRLTLFLILLFAWLPVSVAAVTFVPVIQVCVKSHV
jgi:hypothetical protein